MAKRRTLGRGLEGMLPSPTPPEAPKAAPTVVRTAVPKGMLCPVEDLHPNRDQPRSRFDDAALDELAASIANLGILEPILVRKRPKGGYEIVAGERRWRAAQRAGLREVPIFAREFSGESAFEAALVENLQREDLNPIETARALSRLVEEHGHTQDEVARRIGKKRSTVTNALRLLKLPMSILDLIEEGRLSEGHGRALLQAPSEAILKRFAHAAMQKGWSVRETERQVRAAGKGGEAKEPKPEASAHKNVNLRDLEGRLSRGLGSRCAVDDTAGRGKITIKYASYDELDRLLEHLLPPG